MSLQLAGQGLATRRLCNGDFSVITFFECWITVEGFKVSLIVLCLALHRGKVAGVFLPKSTALLLGNDIFTDGISGSFDA